MPCVKIYCGSTQNPVKRFANHKSCCNNSNDKKKGKTGLTKHFESGCPFDPGKTKTNLNFTLVDFYDTTEKKLSNAGHIPGPKCICVECKNLKNLEDFWILRLGCFHGKSGLNSRDEVKGKVRCKW